MNRRIVYWGATGVVTRPANRRGFAESTLAKGDGRTPLPASGRPATSAVASKVCVPDER